MSDEPRCAFDRSISIRGFGLSGYHDQSFLNQSVGRRCSGAASGPRLAARDPIEDVVGRRPSRIRRTRRSSGRRRRRRCRCSSYSRIVAVRGAGSRSTRSAYGIGALRILVEALHVRVARDVVEVEVVLLHVLAVIALVAGEAEQPLLEDRVRAVPQREREAQPLPVVADAGDAVLAPAVGARSRVVVREVFPRRRRRRCSPRAPCPIAARSRRDPIAATAALPSLAAASRSSSAVSMIFLRPMGTSGSPRGSIVQFRIFERLGNDGACLHLPASRRRRSCWSTWPRSSAPSSSACPTSTTRRSASASARAVTAAPSLAGAFTRAHILAITQAICDYRKSAAARPVRSISARTRTRCRVRRRTRRSRCWPANGVETVFQRDGGFTPTPVISRAILVHNRGRSGAPRRRHRGHAVAQSAGGRRLQVQPAERRPGRHRRRRTWIRGPRQRAACEAGEACGAFRSPSALRARRRRTRAISSCPYVHDLASVVDMESIRAAGLEPRRRSARAAPGVGYWEPINRVLRSRHRRRQSRGRSDVRLHDGRPRRQDPAWIARAPYAMARLVAREGSAIASRSRTIPMPTGTESSRRRPGS